MLVSTGMRDAGYIYVNVDDTWQGKRDAQGNITGNDRFPSMKALADYIHSKGLKFGIYSSPGPKTCAGYEGSLGHEAQDAKTYASWGVDFLKYDLCSYQEIMDKAKAEHPNDPDITRTMMIAAFRKMGDALKASGRPILYSLCQYGLDQPWKWGPGIGAQMWRTTDDINDNYERMVIIGFEQAGLSKYAGPGHWNDPDMLEVGNGKMTEDEYKTHMSLWALLAAPLLAGNDLSKMKDSDKAILMNKDVIRHRPGPLSASRAIASIRTPSFDVWSRPLSGGRVAVALFNRSWQLRELTVDLADLGFAKGGNLRDVWLQKDMGHQAGTLHVMVPRHGVRLFIVSR